MSVIKVDVPNKWASTRYEARIKANNYTIISEQFNDISHPWRQNIGSHHLPRYTRYRVIAGRVIKGGDCNMYKFTLYNYIHINKGTNSNIQVVELGKSHGL